MSSVILKRDDSGPAVKKLQLLLNSQLKPSPNLPIDGAFGIGTENAVKRFQQSYSGSPDGVVGPKTWAALGQKGERSLSDVVNMSIAAAPWLEIAALEFGVHEDARPGKHTQRIIDYHQTTTLKATTDEVPWCSSFVNWALRQAKVVGTGSAAAKSWLQWGSSVTSGRLGAITVIRKKKPGADHATGSASGFHVGFFISSSATHVRLLGGNQADSVKYSNFALASYSIEGHRWPT